MINAKEVFGVFSQNEAVNQKEITVEINRVSAFTRGSLRFVAHCGADLTLFSIALLRLILDDHLGPVLMARRVGTSLSRDRRSC